MVKKDEEYERKTVDLDLFLRRMAFGVKDTGQDVNERHQDRQDVDRKRSDHEGGVFFSEILDESEGHALQALHSRKEPIGRDKERDLKKKGSGAFQRVDRLIVVDPVVFL